MAGVVAEICRKAGISQATHFNWKKRYPDRLVVAAEGNILCEHFRVTQVGMPHTNLTAQFLGLGGVTADGYNRVSVNTPALLFNNAGTGIEATVNNAGTGNDAAFAFKTGFPARALIGLLRER